MWKACPNPAGKIDEITTCHSSDFRGRDHRFAAEAIRANPMVVELPACIGPVDIELTAEDIKEAMAIITVVGHRR